MKNVKSFKVSQTDLFFSMRCVLQALIAFNKRTQTKCFKSVLAVNKTYPGTWLSVKLEKRSRSEMI